MQPHIGIWELVDVLAGREGRFKGAAQHKVAAVLEQRRARLDGLLGYQCLQDKVRKADIEPAQTEQPVPCGPKPTILAAPRRISLVPTRSGWRVRLTSEASGAVDSHTASVPSAYVLFSMGSKFG